MTTSTSLRFALAAVLGLVHGCALHAPHAITDTFAATGTYVRHVRLRVAPAQTQDFEALMERCVEAATAAELPAAYDWLCYRESPGRYWVITFASDRADFAIPTSERPLRSFAQHVAGLAGPGARAEIDRALDMLEYEIEWRIELRQKAAWSTVDAMSTAEHPKARVMLRTVRPGLEAAFERALAERVAFLIDHGYRLPVEGFVTLTGAPGTAVQVVFPRDWPSFHATESFWQFVQHLPQDERDAYMLRKDALMETMLSAEYYDADHRPDASYSARSGG